MATTYWGNINYSKAKQYYVLFKSTSSNISLATNNSKKNWTGTIETSPDKTTWTIWDGITTVSSNTGKIYVRGSNNTSVNNTEPWNMGAVGRWVLTGDNIKIIGNIECLLDYTTVKNGGFVNNVAMGAFMYLFSRNNNIVNASALELPRKILTAELVYADMFYYCENLRKPPKLPATTLSSWCYTSMFRATAITHAPILPAKNLALRCYEDMFYGCKKLTHASALPATTLAQGCYDSMYILCTNLETIPALPANILAPYCYNAMFFGCSKIKLSISHTSDYPNIYKFPSTGEITHVGDYAIDNMFGNTGGSFTGTPDINTTYYTANEIVE